MAEVFDILLDEDFDLMIKDGDFVSGESTEQHQQLLLLAEKGSFALDPLVGVGIRTWLNEDAGVDELKHAIQAEMEKDGMVIQTLDIKTLDNITLEAGYK